MAPYLSNKKEESIQVFACYLHKESGTEHNLVYLVTSKEGVGTWRGGGEEGEKWYTEYTFWGIVLMFQLFKM